MANIDELLEQASEIRDANEEKENTALRVGTMLVDILQYIAGFIDRETLRQILQEYASLSDTGLVNWRQSRCVFLATMGTELDNIDGGKWEYTSHDGDIVFNPSSRALRVVGEATSYSTLPGVIYVNAHTGHLYKWDISTQKMTELVDSSSPTVIDYRNAPAFADIPIGATYYFLSQSSGYKIGVKVDAHDFCSFAIDPKKVYAFLDTRQTAVWNAESQTWTPISGRVINDLITGGEGDALSAEMGKELKRLIDDIEQSGGGGIIISYNENTKTTTFTYGGNVQELSTSPTIAVQNSAIGKTATITHATALRLQYSIDSGTTWIDYTQPIEFTTAGTTVLLARAKESGKAWSEPSTATIVVEGTSQPTISKFSESDNNVTFKATLANATVYISTDGTTWTSGSGSVTLTVNKTTTTQSVTVYAKAKADGMLESSVATQTFEVAAKFQWEPNALGGTSNVALTKYDFKISGLCDADGTNPTSAIADENFSCVAIDGGYRWKILFPTESGSEITTLRGAKKSGTDYLYNLWGEIYSGNTNNKITSIDHMPDSITTLAKLCLSCLKSVGNITIGKNVSSIATSLGTSFVQTSTPSSFDIESGNSTYTTRSGILYKGNQLIQYPNGRPGTELQIESGTTSIGTYAFDGNRTLQKLILPSTITSLASSAALTGMKEVIEIIFDGTFTTLPQTCCYDCSKLAKVTLPASVATIQGFVFYNAPLTEMHMLGSTPPNLLDTSTETFKTHPTVYVPDAAAQAAYQASTNWVTVAGSTDKILVEPS